MTAKPGLIGNRAQRSLIWGRSAASRGVAGDTLSTGRMAGSRRRSLCIPRVGIGGARGRNSERAVIRGWASRCASLPVSDALPKSLHSCFSIHGGRRRRSSSRRAAAGRAGTTTDRVSATERIYKDSVGCLHIVRTSPGLIKDSEVVVELALAAPLIGCLHGCQAP